MNDSPKPKRRWYQFSLKTLMVVVTVATMAFGVWVQYRRQRARENRERLAAVAAILCGPGCAKTRAVPFEMVWSKGSEPEHVYFDFREFPNHYVDMTASGLRSYLEARDTTEVTVVFEVTTRLGCVERIKAVQIGDRHDWTHEWGGSGWVDHEQPSPWDRFRCRNPFD